MAFWSDTNLREPLRQNRWYISFGDGISEENDSTLDSYVFALKECTKPSYKIETTSHVLINHTFNYPKNVVWQPISVKMISARGNNDNSLSRVLEGALNIAGYISPNVTVDNKAANPQISKTNLINNKTIELIQVDANGKNIETWSIYNPIITGVNFGSLTYENDGFVEISFDITYDSADLDVSEGFTRFEIITAGGNNSNSYNYDDVTEEEVARKILNIAKNNNITSVSGKLSPGFPGLKE
jgi:hypothetical protein